MRLRLTQEMVTGEILSYSHWYKADIVLCDLMDNRLNSDCAFLYPDV